jgi:hypothetical protein
MKKDNTRDCPDCQDSLNRRDFVKVSGAATLAAAGAGSLLFPSAQAQAAPTPTSAAETVVKQFYDTLSGEQREAICFPFEHELRNRISANWTITKPLIGNSFYSKEQRELIRQIFKGVTSEDGYERFMRQMEDDSGGFGEYAVAIFGEPGKGNFQWEMTGRHLTMRADGNSVGQRAFGGPIVYGHGEEDDLSKNMFHYQVQRANEVFAALDPEQRKRALLEKAPNESNVPLRDAKAEFPGIAAADLSSDQKELFESVIKTILAPYRQEDVDEVLAILKETGGLDKLHLAFYQQGDLKNDGVWDIWRVEGPGFVWHFRGAPHVHAYVNIGLVNA